jgi:nitrogenase molybdenum-iron protein alpha chain
MSRLFPELEGGAPAAAPLPELPSDGTVVGGTWSASKFDQLFGLPGPLTADGGCRVREARATPDGKLALDMEGGGLPRKTLVAFPAPSGGGVPDFELRWQDEPDHDAQNLILGQAAHRLRQVGLAQLLKVLLADPAKRVNSHGSAPRPEAGRPAKQDGRPKGPDDDDPTPKDMRKSLVQSYGSGEAWYNFFADREQQRNFCFNFAGSVVTIGHEDLECHYATPNIGDGTVSFFNYPRVHERHSAQEQKSNGEPAGPPQKLSKDPSYLISDLQDLDIIKGGAQKLDRVLDGIAEREEKPDMVIMRSTCVPIVIGDDMEGSVERFKQKSDVPIVFLDNIADQFATPFRETFNKLKNDPEFQNPVKIPGSVNLVGFPKLAEMGLLISFLEQLGVKVNCRVVPEVDLKAMKRYRAADVAVLFDTELYKRTYDDVIGGIDLKTIRPAAPYGVEGTRRWLLEVATAVGLEKRFDEAWAKHSAGLESEWKALRKEASGYRLGFVVDSERIKMLTDPRKSTGVPMVSILKEMGFGVDFLLFVGDKESPKDYRKLESRSEKGTITTFSTPEQLEKLLRKSPAQGFYSEVFFDSRLTRCGKAQFSVNFFEMGYGGAVASLKRLLEACRMPFYRKYGAYLGRAF